MSKIHFDELKVLDSRIGELIHKNEFALLFDLRECFKPKTISAHHYARISTAGNLEIHDYGCGLFAVSISVSGQGRLKEDKTYGGVDYHARLHIQSGDDSSWAAWSKPYATVDEAAEIVERMRPLLDELTSLPNEETLNEMLRPFGMFGEAGS